MKAVVSLAALLATLSSAFASAPAFAAGVIYVECNLTVVLREPHQEQTLAAGETHQLVHLPTDQPVELDLAIPGYNAHFYWNIGFDPVTSVEDEAQQIRTSSPGWNASFERGNVNHNVITKMACSADA
jgi:hypothetical protein